MLLLTVIGANSWKLICRRWRNEGRPHSRRVQSRMPSRRATRHHLDPWDGTRFVACGSETPLH